jgi:hypothetical protein
MATFVLTPEQHIFLKGEVNQEKINAILRSASLPALIDTSKKCELEPFVSRPGSGTLISLQRPMSAS